MPESDHTEAATTAGTIAICGADAWVLDGWRRVDIGIRDGLIAEVSSALSGTYAHTFDASGCLALPAALDTHPPVAQAQAWQSAGVTAVLLPPQAPRPPHIAAAQTDWACFDDADDADRRAGEAGFAGRWLDPACLRDRSTLQARIARPLGPRGSMRMVAHLDGLARDGQVRWLEMLLDVLADVMRPVHLRGVRHEEVVHTVSRHPARRLVSGGTTTDALAGADTEPADRIALWQALRGGAGWSLSTLGRGTSKSGLVDSLGLHVAAGSCAWSEAVRWIAQNPAQLFQVRGKGGIVPGLDGDIALVDAEPPHTVRHTLVRGQSTGRHGEQAACGRPLQLLREVAAVRW